MAFQVLAERGTSIASASLSSTTGSGSFFDHVVIIAMENQNYADVLGDGTSAGCPSGTAPFLCSMLPLSSTIPSYHSYGAGDFSGDSISGCSAACYVALVSGQTYGVSDGYSCCLSGTTLVDQMRAAGLTWQAYCEAGCPRGNDHFPFTGFASDYNSPNLVTGSSVSTSTFIAAANSASPPNFLWYTPTDNHNMHDNSIQTGDSYLKTFLVGSGTISSPAAGSLLASSLFTGSSYHSLLYLWWDEYDPSPNILYGGMVNKGYVSTSNAYDEYSSLRTIDSNWGLSSLGYASSTPTISDIFNSNLPLPLSASYTYTPSAPVAGTPVAFTGLATGGTSPYSYSWGFGDGATGTGPTPTHTYSSSGSYSVTVTVTDSAGGSAQSAQTVQVSSVPVLVASFSYSPSQPVSGQPLTFTGIAAGGVSPYSISWSFGDGSTATGSLATHTYTSAGTYAVTETAEDSSSPSQTATSTTTVTVATSNVLAGNFGVCTPLPQGWSCGNTNGLSGSAVNMVNGILETQQSNTGIGNDTSYYHATTQKGTFPWSPCQPPASGVLPANLTSVSVNFTMLGFVPYGSYRYHIYVALYYWLPNGTVTAGGSTYQCLDTQSRVENIKGVFSPVGSTATYNPGDSFGWDNVTLGPVTMGQTYVLSADVAHQCQEDLAAWGLNPNTPCQLAGIEIGTEGFQFQELDVNWYTLNYTTSSTSTQPLTSSFSFSPTAPQAGQSVTFKATAAGGVSPYSYAWKFDDGSTGTGQTAYHTYSIAGTYTVTLTVSDSGSPQQTTTSQQTVAITSSPSPLTASFSSTPSSPQVGEQVSFTATASGGAVPYELDWSFGDGSTGTGYSVTHTYSSAGLFVVTLAVKDSGSPQQTATSQQTVAVSSPPPALTASFTYGPSSPEMGQQVAYTAIASGGSSLYSFSWSFGDGGSSTANPATHTYSSSGSFTVTVTVTDSSGSTASSSQSISVAPAPGVSFSYSPTSPEATSPVAFSASETGGVGPFTFSWAFGDSGTSTSNPASHTYTTSGSFKVTVTATDSDDVKATSSQTITVVAALAASFTYSPSSPEAGQTVLFSGSASGGTSPYSYSWSFGDGSIGTGSSVSYTYSSPGTYMVTLTVKDSGASQQSLTSQQSVSLSSPPPPLSASFSYSPASPQAGEQANFTASASDGAPPYSFIWSFGDGSNGTGSSVTHTYSSAGTYMIVLTVADNGSPQQTATSSTTIDVSPMPLLPTSTTVICPGGGIVGVRLTCSATVVDTMSGSTPTGSVSFTPGSSCTLSGGSCSANMTSTAPGSLAVSASYEGDAEHLASTSPLVFVTINDRETSTTVACAPSTLTMGDDAICSATVTDTSPGATTTPTGNVTFTSTGSCVLTGAGVSATCSTNIASTAVGSLSVYASYLGDSTHNASSAITTVNIVPPPSPPLTADFAFNPPTPRVGQAVNFTATSTGGLPPYSYSWSFGDGSTGSGNPSSHAYESANTYSVVLVVMDANGTAFSETKLLTVIVSPNPAIILVAPISESVDEGANLTFNVSAVEDSARQISLACETCSALGAIFTSDSGSGAASGTFSWTPSEAQGPEVYMIVLSSTDGTQVVNATVTVTVNEVNALPTLYVPGTLIVRDGEVLQFVVTATDPDAPPENVTLTATGLPDGSSFDPATGVFYWPIQGVQPGVYTLTFTATDNGVPPLQDSQTVTVHVDNGNGRCFICDMFLESPLNLDTSPLQLFLRAVTGLLSFLAVITIKRFSGRWQQRDSSTLHRSEDVEKT